MMLKSFFIHGSKNRNVLNCLTVLFNRLIQTGHFPEKWSEGFIIPLHKNGDINTSGIN